MAEFCDRLKELRSSKKIKQQEMADMLGIQLRAYQCYEYGEHYPVLDSVIKIADYFDVSLDYLVGRSDVKERR